MQKIVKTLSDRYTVKVSNKFNQAKFSLSSLTLDFLYLFISQIQCNKTSTEDRSFYTYNISLLEIEKCMGKRIHSSSFEEICKELLTHKILIVEDSLETTFAEICSYDKNSRIFSFKFNDSLIPYLLRVRNNFTTFSRKSIVGFRSIYAKRIYTLLSQFKVTGFFSITTERFLKILDLENSDYSESFYDFRKRVLAPVQKIFEKESSIHFYYKEISSGRKITKIEFTIKIVLEPKIIIEKQKSTKLKSGVSAVEKWIQEQGVKKFESGDTNLEENSFAKFFRENKERQDLAEKEEREKKEKIDKEFTDRLEKIKRLK